MLATKTELNMFISRLARDASLSSCELNRVRWSWLLHPTSESLQALITKLQLERIHPTATVLELENTCLWISIFNPAIAHRRFFHTRVPLLEKIENPETRFENLLIRYFISSRGGNEKQALSHLQTLREIGSSLITEGFCVRSDTLIESIEQLNSLHDRPLSANITVNLGHWEIQAHGKRSISKPLCLFIELLRTNLSISFNELLAAAFDIPNYTEHMHYQKIQNLISRLRTLSPDFVIHTRQGRVYSSISWDQISVRSMSAHQESLKNSAVLDLFLNPEIKKDGGEKAALRVSISKLKSSLETDFSRCDFEKITGFPRSTASRFLKKWIAQEIIIKSGAGKATSYNFK